MIYLDAAATSKPRKEVIGAMMPYLTEEWYNPSALYSPARKVSHVINECRKTIAAYINAEPEEIYFTSGGSESNSWAIQGFIKRAANERVNPIVITSAIEHKSIVECLNSNHKIKKYTVGVDRFGRIEEMAFLSYLDLARRPNSKTLVSVQSANSEIGTVQELDWLSNMTHNSGNNFIFHTDATQYFGSGRINVKKQRIDILTASGHKLGVPKGIGILYIRKGVEIEPLIYGSQNYGMRGGTENVAGIVGFAKAVDLIQKERQENIDCDIGTIEKNYLFFNKLESRFGCKLNGAVGFYDRLPNNLNITFPQNITGESLIYLLENAGIYLSSGSACNSRSNVPSPTLKAIGLSDDEVMRTVRITFRDDITEEDMDRVVEEIDKAIKLLES